MLNRQSAFYVYQNHLLRLRLLADIKFSTLISNLLQPHARLMIIFFTLMLSRMTVLNRIPLAALRQYQSARLAHPSVNRLSSRQASLTTIIDSFIIVSIGQPTVTIKTG